FKRWKSMGPGVEEVKGHVKNYFVNNFSERWEHRPNLNGIQFQSLSAEDNLILMAPFTIDEVREVIWSSGDNKSPGPDGFNFNFMKVCSNSLIFYMNFIVVLLSQRQSQHLS
ncbi:transposon TX1 putative protein, partial [Trifolium medium]|nr:transposon TX1 putative protein [Trifolium medium]